MAKSKLKPRTWGGNKNAAYTDGRPKVKVKR
jgi:hypothetical protein